jgi:mannose-6-phosphate isomerase
MEIVIRPWGQFKVLYDSEYTKVKELTVKPNQRLSYQYHKHRQEHWVVVKGVATVTLDTVTKEFDYNNHIDIPFGIKHRLANNTDDDLIIIEIQTGTYFGEDDIIRLDDDYNRNH